MLTDSGHEHWSTYETNGNHVISHYIDFGFHKKLLSLLPPQKYVTSERGQQPSKEHWDASQIPDSFSQHTVGFGKCGNRATCPQTSIVLASLSRSALFLSEPNGRTPALPCLLYSISVKLSLASHEKQ